MARGDRDYGTFLHETGYGRGFRLFTFSQVSVPFKIEGDRMRLLGDLLSFEVCFHLPEAMESFIKGLFQSAQVDIADKMSKVEFLVKSVERLPDALQEVAEREVVQVQLKPLSPIVAGLQNEKGNYDFLAPEDARFAGSLICSWRNKIQGCYDESTGAGALLLAEVIQMRHPPRSRLITIRAGEPEETRIRGWMNFGLSVSAERRFIDLLLNAGAGLYNSMGCGCVGVVGKRDKL